MRKFLIKVNGNSYEVEVEEVGGSTQRPIDYATAPTMPQPPVKKQSQETPNVEKKEIVASEGQEIVSAPMPGNIWKVLVSEGQEVKAGDILLILEAMKMENEILAPRDGKIANIATKEGVAVNTGDKLVVID